MTDVLILLALALTAAQTSALDAAEKAAGKASTPAAPKRLQALLNNCDAHKFETVIQVPGPDGQPKASRVKLCGTEGQSDADWIRTLRDAVAKTQSNLQMPALAREQIVSAIKTEIARLQGARAPVATAALPPARSMAKAPGRDEYASLPPLPTAPPPVVHVLPGASAALPLLSRPRMTFACLTPGDVGEGPCTDFTRDTLLTVTAEEDLPPGTSLRFVRSGDPRADVELAQLKRGRSVQLSLPPEVCTHATGGRLDIRIVRSLPAAGPTGQEVGEDGPFNLHC